ncbi:DsrE/DsrF/DrsH-like family protein [Clostridium botulinum]|nr:DsrE/DsrF/DrsH-like family protein [Clostridium botulinum]
MEYKLFFDGVEIGGVELYLGATEDSGLNLFI